jgi:hypothetical protein
MPNIFKPLRSKNNFLGPKITYKNPYQNFDLICIPLFDEYYKLSLKFKISIRLKTKAKIMIDNTIEIIQKCKSKSWS